MAQLKYVDWDGLVYYDGKVKAYIDDKMMSCLKMGGHIEFDQLPPPSYNNLNYIYKITDEFTSNDHFMKPGYLFTTGTWVQTVDIGNGVYRYNIFDEADQTTSEILTQLVSLDERVTTVETDVTDLLTKVNGTQASILELDASIEILDQDAVKDRKAVEELDDRIDKISSAVITATDTATSAAKQTAENTIDIRTAQDDIRELKNSDADILVSIADIRDESDTNKSNIENLVSITATQDDRITNSEGRLNLVEDKVVSLDQETRNQAQSIETLSNQILTTETRTAEALAKVSENELSIAEVKNEVAENSDAIDINKQAIKEEAEARTEAIADLEADIETLNNTIAETAAEVESVGANLNEHRVESNGRLSALEEKSDRNESSIDTLNTRLDNKVDKEYVDAAVKNVTVDLTGYATEIFVTTAIAQAQLGGENSNVDLSGYATKDDLNTLASKAELAAVEAKIPSIDGLATTTEVDTAIKTAVDNIDIPEVPTKVSELENDAGYVKSEDIADFITIKDVEDKNYLTAVPEGYATQTWVSEQGFVTDISGKSDADHTHDDYALKTDIPDTSKFITANDIVDKADADHKHTLADITDYEAPVVPTKTSELTNDSGFITAEQVPATDLSDYYNQSEVDQHFEDVAAALEDKQDKLISGTNIATINGKSLLDGGNIEVAGGTISSPDEILLTFAEGTKFAIGGLAADTIITNWSLTKLIQTMLFGTTDTPDEPVYETVTDEIIGKELSMYTQDSLGNIVEVPFVLRTLSEDEAAIEPVSNSDDGFYQITDSEGTVIESGYQTTSPTGVEMPYIISIPSNMTIEDGKIETWSTLDSAWVEATDAEFSTDLSICTDWGVMTQAEVEELEAEYSAIGYDVWVQVRPEEPASGRVYRFITN